MRLLRILFSALVWIHFIVGAVLACLLAALLVVAGAPFPREWRDRRGPHWLVCRMMYAWIKCYPGWDVKVLGRERIPDGAAVIVANHQSMADVLVSMCLRRQFKFVSKSSLFAVPVVGWAMSLCRYVLLERGRVHSTSRMMQTCRAWLCRGMPVL